MRYQTTHSPRKIVTLLPDMALSDRLETAHDVARDYAAGTLNSEDHKSAENLIKLLINDVDTDVRLAVSNHLQTCLHLTRDIAFQLAMDSDQIALPILRTSSALDEWDLVEILSCTNENKRTAIAARKNLSLIATNYIAQYSTVGIAKICLKNPSAIISNESFNHIFRRHFAHPEICELITNRLDLPEEILVQLYQNVSNLQKEYLLKEKGVPHIIADQMLDNEKEQTLANLLLERPSLAEKHKAAVQLNGDGRLTSTLLLRALILGDCLFFAEGLSQKSSTSVKRILSLFDEPNNVGLKNLLMKAAVPSYLKTAFNITIDEVREIGIQRGNSFSSKNQTKVLNRISKYYHFEPNLTVEKSMEKLLER
ncbi:MAG: DUF2336 domain-containing protein [Sneathiella sp.]